MFWDLICCPHEGINNKRFNDYLVLYPKILLCIANKIFIKCN